MFHYLWHLQFSLSVKAMHESFSKKGVMFYGKPDMVSFFIAHFPYHSMKSDIMFTQYDNKFDDSFEGLRVAENKVPV